MSFPHLILLKFESIDFTKFLLKNPENQIRFWPFCVDFMCNFTKKKFLRKKEIISSNSLYLCQILMSCLKYIFSYKATRSLLLRHAKLHIVFEATTLKLPSVGQWIHISSGPIRKFFWFKTILLVNGGILINQKF